MNARERGGTSRLAVGQELPPLSIAVTSQLVIMGAAASRDSQPQHHDYRYAVEHAGLPNIIVNAPTLSGYLSRYVTDWSGPEGRIARLRLRMSTPICPGDVMQLRGSIDAVKAAPLGWWWVRLSLRIGVGEQLNAEGAAIVSVPGENGVQPWKAQTKEWFLPDWNLQSIACPISTTDGPITAMTERISARKPRNATHANRTAGAVKRAARGRPRSQESEDAIINATMALLKSQGYGGVTLDKVAARAKASKPTIYRRWPSKEHLVIAAFDRFPPLKAKDKGDVLEELLDLYEQFIAIMHQRPMAGVLPMLAGEWAHNPKLAAAMEPLVEKRREPIAFILQRAISRGQLPEGIDLDLAQDLVMGPLLQRLFFRRADVSRGPMRKLLQIVLSGLRTLKRPVAKAR